MVPMLITYYPIIIIQGWKVTARGVDYLGNYDVIKLIEKTITRRKMVQYQNQEKGDDGMIDGGRRNRDMCGARIRG